MSADTREALGDWIIIMGCVNLTLLVLLLVVVIIKVCQSLR